MDTDTYPMVAMDLDPVGFGGQYGYYTDTETGLVLLGARYYDPSTGRFLNRDPIGYDGGVNLYGFCGNNPVNYNDPRGDGAAASPGSGNSHFGPSSLHTSTGNEAPHPPTTDETIFLLQLNADFEEGLANAERQQDDPEAAEGAEEKVQEDDAAILVLQTQTNCFVAGTLVEMADGTTKKIEDVREGDLVLSRNPETGVTEAKLVVSRSVKAAPQVLTLTLTDPATHLMQTITCTPGHPFYVQGRGFVLAGDLGIGTSIVTRAGPCLSVTNIAYEPKSTGGVLVYNFTVEDDHTYFVGTLDGGTWVHNNSPAATPVLPNRTQAFNQAKDFAKIPRSQQPDEQWQTGDDASRASYPNYRLSSDPDTHGRYYQYNTPNGPRVIAEHLNDGPPHFHAGMPKDNATFSGFKNERYLKVPGQPKHIYYRTK